MHQVANKLYQLSYISGEIEQFATNMLLSAVDQHAAGAALQPGSIDERGEREVRDSFLFAFLSVQTSIFVWLLLWILPPLFLWSICEIKLEIYIRAFFGFWFLVFGA